MCVSYALFVCIYVYSACASVSFVPASVEWALFMIAHPQITAEVSEVGTTVTYQISRSLKSSVAARRFRSSYVPSRDDQILSSATASGVAKAQVLMDKFLSISYHARTRQISADLDVAKFIISTVVDLVNIRRCCRIIDVPRGPRSADVRRRLAARVNV